VNKPISTGNIRMFLTSCTCGRTWETDTELRSIPAHGCHRLVSDQVMGSAIATYVCTGCSWKVEVHIDDDAALNRAFATHLLTTATEAAAS
jgi:hypothetical protein